MSIVHLETEPIRVLAIAEINDRQARLMGAAAARLALEAGIGELKYEDAFASVGFPAQPTGMVNADDLKAWNFRRLAFADGFDDWANRNFGRPAVSVAGWGWRFIEQEAAPKHHTGRAVRAIGKEVVKGLHAMRTMRTDGLSSEARQDLIDGEAFLGGIGAVLDGKHRKGFAH